MRMQQFGLQDEKLAFDRRWEGRLRGDLHADAVELNARDSFPASDPPGWTGVVVGRGRVRPEQESGPASLPRRIRPPFPWGEPRPRVRIYRPAPSVLQAGRRGTKRWVLEFEPAGSPELDLLMGWSGSQDPRQNVRLTFPSRESAEAFAKRQGWHYTVSPPHERRVRPKSYADDLLLASTAECAVAADSGSALEGRTAPSPVAGEVRHAA